MKIDTRAALAPGSWWGLDEGGRAFIRRISAILCHRVNAAERERMERELQDERERRRAAKSRRWA